VEDGRSSEMSGKADAVAEKRTGAPSVRLPGIANVLYVLLIGGIAIEEEKADA
jgi:hypothetical protein